MIIRNDSWFVHKAVDYISCYEIFISLFYVVYIDLFKKLKFLVFLFFRFEALIEREWIQAGYPFVQRHHRSAMSNPVTRTKENAPTFLLFIDCTWQIMQQFPCSFEFNEGFLLQLSRHSYCSQFGSDVA